MPKETPLPTPFSEATRLAREAARAKEAISHSYRGHHSGVCVMLEPELTRGGINVTNEDNTGRNMTDDINKVFVDREAAVWLIQQLAIGFGVQQSELYVPQWRDNYGLPTIEAILDTKND